MQKGRDLFEFPRFIQGNNLRQRRGFLAILGIRIVRANQYVEAGMGLAESHGERRDRSPRAFGDRGSRRPFHLPDAANRFRHVARLSASSPPGTSLRSSGRRSTNSERVICDKDPSFSFCSRIVRASLENDISERKYIRGNSILL